MLCKLYRDENAIFVDYMVLVKASQHAVLGGCDSFVREHVTLEPVFGVSRGECGTPIPDCFIRMKYQCGTEVADGLVKSIQQLLPWLQNELSGGKRREMPCDLTTVLYMPPTEFFAAIGKRSIEVLTELATFVQKGEFCLQMDVPVADDGPAEAQAA